MPSIWVTAMQTWLTSTLYYIMACTYLRTYKCVHTQLPKNQIVTAGELEFHPLLNFHLRSMKELISSGRRMRLAVRRGRFQPWKSDPRCAKRRSLRKPLMDFSASALLTRGGGQFPVVGAPAQWRMGSHMPGLPTDAGSATRPKL